MKEYLENRIKELKEEMASQRVLDIYLRLSARVDELYRAIEHLNNQ